MTTFLFERLWDRVANLFRRSNREAAWIDVRHAMEKLSEMQHYPVYFAVEKYFWDRFCSSLR